MRPPVNEIIFQLIGPAGMATVMVATGVFSGCEAPPRDVDYNRPRTSDESGQVSRVLSAGEQAEVRAALRDVAEGHEPVAPPVTAGPAGMRWSDVPGAVKSACSIVEMALDDVQRTDDGYEFQLRTIEDWPGRIVIRRTGDERVYEVVEATIGRFPDEPDRVARRDALLEAIRQQMLAYGAFRKFRDPAGD